MVVTIKFVGVFRSVSGKDKIVIETKDKISLRSALKEIGDKLPKTKQVLIDPELENLRINALILVNGKEINVLSGLDTVLEEETEVVFVPVVHGG